MALIICPNCGKQFSEHAKACPQCGISIEEALILIQKREEESRLAAEREAAERERIRKEREEKEAEEARIRAEQRAEWWAANKKKVGIAILIIIAIIGIIVTSVKVTQAITKNEEPDKTLQSEEIDYNQVNAYSGASQLSNNEDNQELWRKSVADNGYWDVLSDRKLVESDLRGKSADELSILRNSIYARHGYRFKKQKYLDYFGQFDWYRPNTDNQQVAFNRMSSIEKYNVNFIREHE